MSKDTVRISYKTARWPLPTFISFKPEGHHNINVANGKHSNISEDSLEDSSGTSTIITSYVPAGFDREIAAAHLAINGLPDATMEVTPPEALVFSNGDNFRILPPAVAVYHLKNIANTKISEIRFDVS